MNPVNIDRIICYDPEQAYTSESGFGKRVQNALFDLEDKSWWFHARADLILHFLSTWKKTDNFSFLEVGCGNGYVLQRVHERFPECSVTGAELSLAGLKNLAKRCPNATLVQMDILDMPYENDFDVVGCFDVLEHIEDDRKAIAGLFRALKSGGGGALAHRSGKTTLLL